MKSKYEVTARKNNKTKKYIVFANSKNEAGTFVYKTWKAVSETITKLS